MTRAALMVDDWPPSHQLQRLMLLSMASLEAACHLKQGDSSGTSSLSCCELVMHHARPGMVVYTCCLPPGLLNAGVRRSDNRLSLHHRPHMLA